MSWLAEALTDLDDALTFLDQRNPKAAAHLARAVHQSVTGLLEHPAKGRPGRVPGTRELVIPQTRYIVPYRVQNE